MAHIKSIDQNSLLENCLQQKAWAHKQLYEMYQAVLFPICVRYAVDGNEAKDMFQEGFIRIFNNLKQYRNEGSLEGWLKRVMVTTALNYIKKHRKQLYIDVATQFEEKLSYAHVDNNNAVSDIMQALHSLPYNYRVILTLHAIEGYNYTELSKLLNIEESSCRTRVFRSKQLLQKILEKNNLVKNTTDGKI